MAMIIFGAIVIAFGIAVLITRKVSISNGSQSTLLTGAPSVVIGILALVGGVASVVAGIVNVV